MSILPDGPRPYYYFAYGSNLNLDQMRRRCPAAEPVCRYTVEGLRLVFRRVLDVVPDSSSVVHGALWKITGHCERSLNKYEGYRVSQNGLYLKSHFRVGDRNIMLYYMNPARDYPSSPPTPTYLHTVAEGYRDFRLNPSSLFDAVERSIRATEERSRRAKKSLVMEEKQFTWKTRPSRERDVEAVSRKTVQAMREHLTFAR